MKLLHFSDLHLDTPFAWAPPEVARDRRAALRATLTRITDLAGQLGVDAITCAGDLYEQERFTPDTAAFLRAAFAAVHPLPVLIAPGNHDWFGPWSLYAQVDWTDNVHVFTTDTLTAFELTDGLTVWGGAHRAPANTDGFLDAFTVERGGAHLGLFHGSANGEVLFQGEGKVPHAPFRAEQVRAAGLGHALVGHYHRPSDAEDYTYPGNPDPLTFGEDGLRAAVEVHLGDDGQVTDRIRHQVATSQAHDITVDVTGAEHTTAIATKVAEAVAGLSGAVRITVTGDIPPQVDLRPGDIAAAARAVGIEAVLPRLGAIHVTYDLEALAAEATVRGQFVRDVQGAPDLDDDTRRRVLITGLRALDGRGDELEVC